MPGNLNQKEEKKYFEMFRQDYSLPEGKVIYGDKPDVIINGPRKIGVELTNIYLKDGSSIESEQVQAGLRDRVVLKAQQLYLQENGKNIELSFSFDKERPILDGKKLERQLADLGKRIEKQGEGSISKEIFAEIPELSYVYLNPNECPDSRWRVPQKHDGQAMSRDRLLKNIQDKEGKVAQYEECDAYWLVIVVDFYDRAQDQEILIRDFEKIESEKFEKIFVYRTAMRQVLEVK